MNLAHVEFSRGNVLTHYVNVCWDVLDKYETGEKIINKDVVDFKPIAKYDLIFSISTLEHVGFDEFEKDSEKILRAIDNVKSNCLAPGGKFFVTLPIGWNYNLDKFLKDGKINFAEVYYFKRISWDNQWQLSSKSEVLKTKFSKPFIGANGLVVGVL